MPIYEHRCLNDHSRDVFEHHPDNLGCDTIICETCGHSMAPVPSYGRGLLYFEEGKGRWIHNLGHDPVYITSRKQHIEAMKRAGVSEAPAIPPKTKLTGRAKENGRWI